VQRPENLPYTQSQGDPSLALRMTSGDLAMDETEIIDFTREAIVLMIKISAPVMMVGLVVGVIISLIQALTQIQEMTLSFVPKMLAIYLTIFLMFPAMSALLIAFMEKIADKIVGMS
jgi:flagellar biosynthetic protein FliQ